MVEPNPCHQRAFSHFCLLVIIFFFTDCAKTMCLFVGKSVLMDKKHAKKKKKAKLPKQTLITVSKAFNYEGEVRNTCVCVCVSGVSGGIKALMIILHMVTG